MPRVLLYLVLKNKGEGKGGFKNFLPMKLRGEA